MISKQQERFTYSDMNDLFMRFNFDLDAVAEKLHEHDQDLAEIIRCMREKELQDRIN